MEVGVYGVHFPPFELVFSRDCIPSWISREEALDVCARTPREATDKVHFVGTSAQVLERLRPTWISL
jgi:hypothetical protein